VIDKDLLKLLEAGVGLPAAASQLGVGVEEVQERLREYVSSGILRCVGDREAVDWRAYGEWMRLRKPVAAA